MDLFQFFTGLLLLSVTETMAGEPHCSRFHYEEKLLEKMVRMEVRMEEIEKKLEAAAENNGVVKHDLKDLKSSYLNSKVAFFAKAEQHQMSMAKYSTIIFETVVTNVGNSYHHTCGKFVAPKAGMYIFFSTVLGLNHVTIYLRVALNDTNIVNFYANKESGGHDSGSVAVALQLNVGDIVTIKNNDAGGNINGHGYSSFGGFILY